MPQVDAIGRRFDTIVKDGQRAGIAAELTSGDGSRTELSHRFEISVPNSAPRTVLVNTRAMPHSGGETQGWVGTLADITAEAGAEAAMYAARIGSGMLGIEDLEIDVRSVVDEVTDLRASSGRNSLRSVTPSSLS